MADKEPVVVEETVQETETAEPTTTEETQDTDVELEDIEVKDTELEANDDDETEEEPEDEDEPEASEESETEEQPVSDGQTDEGEDDSEETSEEDTTTDDVAKKAFEERDKRRKETEEQRTKDKSEAQDKYLQDAEDDKDLALRQLQIDAYNNRVDANITKIESGINRAVADIGIFRKGTPEQKEILVSRLDDFETMYVTKDKNGDPTEVRSDVYQFLKKEAGLIENLSKVGARQGKKDATNTRARTIASPTRKPTEPKVDSDIADFDAENERIG